MTFELETWPRLRFENNPLKVVVAQVRYPTTYVLADPAVLAKIQDDIGPRFDTPLPPTQEVVIALTPQGPSQVGAQQGAARFSTSDQKWVLSIGQGMASIETTDYSGWEGFKPELERLLRLVESHGHPSGLTRFGIRYVDEVGIPGFRTTVDWAAAISERVLGDPASLARDARAVHMEQRIVLRIEDDALTALYGFIQNPDPQGEPQSTFVIDTDIYCDAAQPWDVGAVLERAERYHGWMTNVFVRSLTDQGVKLLGGTGR